MDKKIEKLDMQYLEAQRKNKDTSKLDKKSKNLERLLELKELQAKHMFENVSTEEIRIIAEKSKASKKPKLAAMIVFYLLTAAFCISSIAFSLILSTNTLSYVLVASMMATGVPGILFEVGALEDASKVELSKIELLRREYNAKMKEEKLAREKSLIKQKTQAKTKTQQKTQVKKTSQEKQKEPEEKPLTLF